MASTVGVTSKPEVTVLPLPQAATPEGELALAGVSNAAAASCCSSCSDGGPPAPPATERHVLIVASDGLWEWVSNTTAVAIAAAAATGESLAAAALGRLLLPGSCCLSCLDGQAPPPPLLQPPAAEVAGRALLRPLLLGPLRSPCAPGAGNCGSGRSALAPCCLSQALRPPHRAPPCASPPHAAEDAAHALVEAAQKQWAVRYRGRNCDDVTVVVAFLER